MSIQKAGPALGVIIAVLLIGVLAVLSGADGANATSFNPTASVCVDNADTPADCDGSDAPGANSDLLTNFSVPAPDSNFGGVISFTPPDWGVPAGADITPGAVVGQLFSTATLSLGAGGCNTTVKPVFTLVNASTNTADTIDYTTDPASKPNDRLIPLAQDKDNNGIPDGADHYPLFLTNIDSLKGLTPRERQFGWQDVAGGTIVLQYLVFDKGTTFPTLGTPDPALGYPSVVILNDTTSAPSAGLIGDFCSPLSTTTKIFGFARENKCAGAPTATGCGDPAPSQPPKNRRGVVVGNVTTQKYRTNPAAAGDYVFATFASSLRDADNDGIENPLDACPVTPDPGFDPRQAVSPGDTDGDGIPNSCDPDPNVASPIALSGPNDLCPTSGIYDQDGDCYGNRQDNCPLIKNGIDRNGNVIGSDNQVDTDGDGIGDACDPNPTVPDGHVHLACVATDVKIGGGSGTAPDMCSKTVTGTFDGPNGQVFLAAAATATTDTPGPTPTFIPGTTTRPTVTPAAARSGGGSSGVGGSGVGSGPAGGIGTLAPVGTSVPSWSVALLALGAAGILAGLSLTTLGMRRRRRQQPTSRKG